MINVWLRRADDESSRAAWREKLSCLGIGLALGLVVVVSVLVPPVERLLNIVFIGVVGIGLGLLAVGWLVVQLIAEIELRRWYDTPEQREEALRQGELAWRARQAAMAAKLDEFVPTAPSQDNPSGVSPLGS